MVEGYNYEDTEDTIDDNAQEVVEAVEKPQEVIDAGIIQKEKVPDPENELSKLLTGIDMRENPTELMWKMLSDRKQVFQKYGIKSPEEVDAENEYDSYNTYIMSFIAKNNIVMNYVSKEDLPIGADPRVLAFVTNANTIGVVDHGDDIDRQGQNYPLTLSLLHETIHVLQARSEEKLSPERIEYEAHVVADLLEHIFIASKKIPPGISVSGEEGVRQISSISTFSLMKNVLDSTLLGYTNRGVSAEEIPFMYKI